MALTEQQLLDLKEKIADAKTEVSELTGQQTALMKQLKDDYGCKTIKEAEAKLKEMEDSIASIDKKIAKGVKELEELYNE
jgi:peptidoglycan hydrolase CwlO-like protein